MAKISVQSRLLLSRTAKARRPHPTMKNRLLLVVAGPLVAALGAIAASVIEHSNEPRINPSGVVNIHGSNNQLHGGTIVGGSHNSIVIQGSQTHSDATATSSLVGAWKGRMRAKTPKGEFVFSGISALRKDGSYAFSGELKTDVTPFSTVSSVVGAGTWRPTHGGYSIRLTDAKTVKAVLQQQGEADVDLTLLLSRTGLQPIFRYEDFTPRGTVNEFSVVELTETTLRSTGKDFRGVAWAYEGTRLQ
ncbi:hypothetical protein [Variovorax sp.]|uniref:hypothetical protein n=1 Tax=Variovorax sp. TaxID=1871043 RepID=UPI002D6743B6|nr:hypothetical protein [Variovorax sp.]HYP82493.1 hypothetical protein [Variovorax sp.]